MSKQDKYTMPNTITLRFVGIPNVKQLYRGDNDVFCDTEKPETCIVNFDLKTAANLLRDHAPEWEMVGKDRDLKTWIADQLGVMFNNKVQGSAASQVLKGGAKIVNADGTEIHLPAGSRVIIEMPGASGKNEKPYQPPAKAEKIEQPEAAEEVAETADAEGTEGGY